MKNAPLRNKMGEQKYSRYRAMIRNCLHTGEKEIYQQFCNHRITVKRGKYSKNHVNCIRGHCIYSWSCTAQNRPFCPILGHAHCGAYIC